MTSMHCGNCGASSFTHKAPDPTFCICRDPLIAENYCITCGNDIEPLRLSELNGTVNYATGEVNKSVGTRVKKAATGSTKTQQSVPSNAVAQVLSSDAITKEDVQAIIRAQNRTTHAVRAFVRFLFIQLSSTTAAVALWNVGDSFINQESCINYGNNCDGNGFFYFVAAIVLIGGVIWSSSAGWSELAKSEVI